MRSQARPSQMTARRPRDDFDYEAQLNQLMRASGEAGEVGQVLRAPPEWGPQAGDWMLRQTGSPLLATATEMMVDPLNLIPGGKAAAAVPIGIGAVRGMKRVPPMYHGTSAPMDVIQEGFRKGSSAELNTPGTSLSRDPTVAMRRAFAGKEARNVLRVDPNVAPSDVRNLSFGEYNLGVVPEDAVFNKPSAGLYQEAETFLRRPGKNALVSSNIRQLSPRERLSVERQAEDAEFATRNAQNVGKTDFTADPGATLGALAQGVIDTRGNRGAFDNFMINAVKKLATAGRWALPTGAPSDLANQAQRAVEAQKTAADLASLLQNVGKRARISDIHDDLTPFITGETGDQLSWELDITPDKLKKLGLWKPSKSGDQRITKDDLVTIANNAQREWVKQRNAVADALEKGMPMGGNMGQVPFKLQEQRARKLRRPGEY